MLIKNLETHHKGVWLSTNSTLKHIIVWNTHTSTKDSWDIKNTECLFEDHVEQGDDVFSNLLQAITSPSGLEIINESELMLLATKSIIYFLEAGCLNSKETLEESIKTTQEVMYHAVGDVLYCGSNRDEIILFIHQKIPSIMQGAYWGYALSALSPKAKEEGAENAHETEETTETEMERDAERYGSQESDAHDALPSSMPDFYRTRVQDNTNTKPTKGLFPYYGCCSRFCFGRRVERTSM